MMWKIAMPVMLAVLVGGVGYYSMQDRRADQTSLSAEEQVMQSDYAAAEAEAQVQAQIEADLQVKAEAITREQIRQESLDASLASFEKDLEVEAAGKYEEDSYARNDRNAVETMTLEYGE